MTKPREMPVVNQCPDLWRQNIHRMIPARPMLETSPLEVAVVTMRAGFDDVWPRVTPEIGVIPLSGAAQEVVALYIFEQGAAGRRITIDQAIRELASFNLLDPALDQDRGMRPSILRGALDEGLISSLIRLGV